MQLTLQNNRALSKHLMKLEQQLKTALNDNHLLMLGAQVLFGFQFNGTFQEMFDSLSAVPRAFFNLGPHAASHHDRSPNNTIYAAPHC